MLKRNDDPELVVSSTGLSTFAAADASRAAELQRVKALATLVLVGHADAVRRRQASAQRPSRLRLHRGLRRSRDHRRARRLVRRGGAVQAAAGLADPAHRDHPEQSAAYRRETRRIHREELPGGRSGRRQAQADRFWHVHRGLAARPQAQRRSRAVRPAPAAGSVLGNGVVGPDDLHHPPRHHAGAFDRSGAAGGRRAARLRAGGQA